MEKDEEREACGKNVWWRKRRRSGKRKARVNEIVVKVVLIVQVLLCSVVATWSPVGEDHLSQRKKSGRVEAKETSWGSWRLNHFEKAGAHHVGCVGDNGGDVSDGCAVEDSHDLPCNLPIHWNTWRRNLQELPPTLHLYLSCYCCGFLFCKHSICIFGFNISQLFLLHSYPPQIIDISRAICEHVSIWLSTSWICVRISFVFPRFFYNIFFPRILCCEASIIMD